MQKEKHVGLVVGYGVWIFDSDSVIRLFNQGFGKGILSRSKPNFFTPNTKKYEQQINKEREAFHAKQISQRKIIEGNKEKECLQLSAVESFYLQDSLQNINIFTNSSSNQDENKILSTEELWKMFVQLIGIQFIADYCAYCQYRNKGWIVRGGLKYGVDYVLYSSGGPNLQHAALTVSVQFVKSIEDSSGIYVERFVSLNDIQALSRITETVSKGLLLCFVYVIGDLDLNSSEIPVACFHPSVLDNFAIKDFVIRRWDPTKIREKNVNTKWTPSEKCK